VAKKSGQKFIARNRAPRVQIEYDVEVYGSQKTIQLPFVMGVMADLSGKPVEPLPAVADRKFLEIDIDNFDQRLKAMKPRVAFAVPNTLTGEGNLQVDITFESMDDFSPAAIARKVEPLRKLLETRTQLSNLMTYMDGKTGAEDLIGKMLADPGLLSALGATRNPAASRASAAPAAVEPSNGPAVEAPMAAEPTGEASDTESTDSSGKEGEGTDDLDSLLDQLN
jgi:type VI secretion system ImpB/VipA family protein